MHLLCTSGFRCGRVLENSQPIENVHATILERYVKWIDFFSTTSLTHLVTENDVRSNTVLPISGSPELIHKIKIDAKGEGLLLGEGYGNWKTTSFRIANFPAISPKEITALMKFLKKY